MEKSYIKTALSSLGVLVILSTILFLLLSIPSQAITNEFDAEYYASRYPDVVSVLGTDPEVLFNHYLTYGIKEGRYQNKWEEDNKIVNSSNLTPKENNVSTTEPVVIVPIEGYNTYIDVSLDYQTVTYFKDGEVVFQSPCVTGNVRAKRGTPVGTYSIKCKIPGKRLKGPTWDCWVNRWMRFTNNSIGFHDASWRSTFGGEIYKTNGSHGCVNLPKDKAYELYDLVEVGTTVIVH